MTDQIFERLRPSPTAIIDEGVISIFRMVPVTSRWRRPAVCHGDSYVDRLLRLARPGGTAGANLLPRLRRGPLDSDVGAE